MAYPLTAPITVNSKADKLSVVMAMGIVISFFAWEPLFDIYEEGELSCVK
jgi:hypothetical protein